MGELSLSITMETGPVAWTRMCAPRGLMDPAPDATIDEAVKASPRSAQYGQVVGHESAYELPSSRKSASSRRPSPRSR
ncbi:helicase HerA-like domain-containing protein [Demequina lutea]|uniref:Helicase HerA-like C-terminal domain-containing protein n=1 Tax=Demequina lutea TaxID=431489 RepID=A0A7Y9Z900_9MICO|nr:hypothetical protein [Demequina lutea]